MVLPGYNRDYIEHLVFYCYLVCIYERAKNIRRFRVVILFRGRSSRAIKFAHISPDLGTCLCLYGMFLFRAYFVTYVYVEYS